VASLNKKPDIGVHKADFHSDVLAIGKNSAPVSAALLYEAEDVVPSTTRAINTDIAVEERDELTGHNSTQKSGFSARKESLPFGKRRGGFRSTR
jgi:hypothetical protein